MEKGTTGLRPPGCQEHSSQMVGWREQKDIRVWSKKVLGLDVVVPESFARSERLVYLLICLRTPRERWGQAEQLAIYFWTKHQNRALQ